MSSASTLLPGNVTMFVTRLPTLMPGLTAFIPNHLGHPRLAIGETSYGPGPLKVPSDSRPAPL